MPLSSDLKAVKSKLDLNSFYLQRSCRPGTLQATAVDSAGFISMDCEATSDFTDPITGIKWTTDVPFISTGINAVLDTAVTTVLNEKQLQTLRYFPADRSNHCYSLPAAPNSTFLIRATFLHGGFLPSVDNSFSISIGSTNVDDSASWFDGSIDTIGILEYVVHTASAVTNDHIFFCLIPSATPAFINSLELRPLEAGMYPSVFKEKYLKGLLRLNCGAGLLDPPIRYPDDLYDRVWYTPGSNFDITTNQTSTDIPLDHLFDNPPLKVLQSAWDAPLGFWFSFTPTDYELKLTQKFYIHFYFTEVEDVGAFDTRSFGVDMNGEIFGNVTLNATSVEGLHNYSFTITSVGAKFTFSPQSVLNSAEIYASRDIVPSSSANADGNFASIFLAIFSSFVHFSVSALEEFKTSLGLASWVGDPCFHVPYSWVTCDQKTSSRVTAIKLSNYNLSGTIPASVADLTALTDIWLHNNEITRLIPDLSKVKNLETLLLQNNSISGPIPESLGSLTSLKELTSGNDKLCAPTANCKVVLPTPPAPDPVNMVAIIGGIVGGVVAVTLTVGSILLFCYCRGKRPVREPIPAVVSSPALGNTTDIPTGASTASNVSNQSGTCGAAAVKQARAFTLHEVQVATNNYKIKIGEGGFGPVYYGRLPDGTEVAVKMNSETSNQGTTEFINEVWNSACVNLKAIYTAQTKILMLMRSRKRKKDMKRRISWKERLGIALNSARGLEYLHNDCLPKIIHRDIKSNNILLNEKLLAKVADFGISKLAPDEDETGGVSTIVRGTTGYLDPEYFAHSKLTQKSDVFSFGVVLLEMICGRLPNLQKFTDPREHNLVEWARGQMNSNNLEAIIDPHIRGTYNRESMWKLAELAMNCVEPYGVNRPNMTQVVRELSIAVDMEDQKPASYGSQPWTPASGQGGDYRAETSDYSSTFRTENSYPATKAPLLQLLSILLLRLLVTSRLKTLSRMFH
ncbi:hypothetical protein R1flu_007582 [Riccia fluitans]|uniref:non-specific serine/threonine protein kinase n=1 Tax=Riccia fluitans TaxID=41844 RepID=A0ABD1YZH7_9MARC